MKKLYLLSCLILSCITICVAQDISGFIIIKDDVEAGSHALLQDYGMDEKLQLIGKYNQDIKSFPDSIQLYYDRANYYLLWKEYNAAIADYSKYIKKKPTDKKAFIKRSNVFLLQGNYKSAIADYTTITKLDPTDITNWINRSNAYSKSKKYDLALSDIEAALKIDPQNSASWNAKCNIYIDAHKYDIAILDFTNALKKNPGLAVLYDCRGRIYEAQGNYKDAFTQYVSPDKNDKHFIEHDYIDKCNEYLNIGRGDLVVTLISYIEEFNYASESLFGNYKIEKNTILGRAYYLMKDYTNAENYFGLAINADSTSETVWQYLINANLAHSNFESGIKNLEKLLERNDLNDFYKTKFTLELVKFYCFNYQFSDAEETLIKFKKETGRDIFTEKNTNDALSVLTINYLLVCKEYIANSNYTQALSVLNHALIKYWSAADTTHDFINEITYSNILAQTSWLYEKTDNNEKAIEYLKKAKLLNPFIKENTYVSIETQKNDLADNNTFIIPPITKDDHPEYHAILIACSNYSESDGWNPLPGTLTEAQQVKEMLSSKYGFKEANILELYNKDYATILSGLSTKLASMKENDNLVIYFAGHGTYKQKGNELIGYWVPLNAKSMDVDYISSTKLAELVAGSNVKHLLMLSDACYGGAMRSSNEMKPPGQLEYKLKSRQVLTSGGLEKVPGNSVFVPMVMKALQLNTNKYLSVAELYNIIYNGVKKQTDNEPRLNDFGKDGNEGGQFYFVLKN
jgi:tetratricopeptide (TPR) repeat protein